MVPSSEFTHPTSDTNQTDTYAESSLKIPCIFLSFFVLILPNILMFLLQKIGRRRTGYLMEIPQNNTVEIGPGNLKMTFSSNSGQLQRMFNTKTGVSSFHFLDSSADI